MARQQMVGPAILNVEERQLLCSDVLDTNGKTL